MFKVQSKILKLIFTSNHRSKILKAELITKKVSLDKSAKILVLIQFSIFVFRNRSIK